MSSKAQQDQDARLWLTTPDRAALLSLQPGSLHFSSEAAPSPVLTVDDAQRFQSIDGFGFALTGGSAQLLMRMGAPQRAALLKELFTAGGSGIGVSYLRVSIGSPETDERGDFDDELPPRQAAVGIAK